MPYWSLVKWCTESTWYCLLFGWTSVNLSAFFQWIIIVPSHRHYKQSRLLELRCDFSVTFAITFIWRAFGSFTAYRWIVDVHLIGVLLKRYETLHASTIDFGLKLPSSSLLKDDTHWGFRSGHSTPTRCASLRRLVTQSLPAGLFLVRLCGRVCGSSFAWVWQV